MPSGACVIRYEGARGVTWKVKYRDADGIQVKETVGSEREGHDARHGALTSLAAAGVSPMASMGIAGHRSMATTKQYVHLAGVVFRDEAAALENHMLGVPESGTEEPERALPSSSG